MNLDINNWNDIEDLTCEEKLDEEIKKDLIELLVLESLENKEGNID